MPYILIASRQHQQTRPLMIKSLLIKLILNKLLQKPILLQLKKFQQKKLKDQLIPAKVASVNTASIAAKIKEARRKTELTNILVKLLKKLPEKLSNGHLTSIDILIEILNLLDSDNEIIIAAKELATTTISKESKSKYEDTLKRFKSTLKKSINSSVSNNMNQIGTKLKDFNQHQLRHKNEYKTETSSEKTDISPETVSSDNSSEVGTKRNADISPETASSDDSSKVGTKKNADISPETASSDDSSKVGTKRNADISSSETVSRDDLSEVSTKATLISQVQ